jgi:hypothetical protein
MPDFYKQKIPIIRRSFDEGFLRGLPDPEHMSRGAVPRDYAVDPVEMRDSPNAMTLYDPSDYGALYDAGEENQDTLEHLYLRAAEAGEFEFLDQNGFPDCWMHSPAHAVMLDRLKQNLPFVKLNAVAAATMTGRTNGGWCGLGMKKIRDDGIPAVGPDAPYQSRRYNNTPALRADMAKYKGLEDWYDLGRQEWDQTLSDRQISTCLFNNLPVPSDYNRHAHSVLSIRKVRVERGFWGWLTLNSWKGFGYHGLCVMTEPINGACALRSSTPSE